ncbi:MAG: chlorophyll synthesis pathway protein BchC [Betaproteobacteria bacterium]|nr:chlorophyll synthesis pathway protein BchC [Betaproteobacteria bacterium]
MNAQAIVFKSPQQLAVEELNLPKVGDEDIQIEVEYSGISTGTERLLWDGSMPPFPGMGYPLVPGYETVGRVVQAGSKSKIDIGQRVFVPGANCFEGIRSLFGASASHLVTNHSRVMPVDESLGAQAVLLALAATAYHAVSMGGKREKIIAPDLIIGHGIMGRLLARMTVVAGEPAPTVWETQAARRTGAQGYQVVHPNEDNRRDYQAIYDVSGDASLLNQLILRLKPGGEIVLAGFYKEKLSFDYAPAFMREAQIRTAAEWKRPDLLAVTELVNTGMLSLNDLITHQEKPSQAKSAYEVAFGDALCLKMVLDWSANA